MRDSGSIRRGNRHETGEENERRGKKEEGWEEGKLLGAGRERKKERERERGVKDGDERAERSSEAVRDSGVITRGKRDEGETHT